MGRYLALGIAGAATLYACGGEVKTGSGVGDADTPQRGSEWTDGGAAGPGDTVLPECRLGFHPDNTPGLPCHFDVDGRCYDSKDDACACACTRPSGTTCVSGFPVYDGHVAVTCN